MDIVIELLRKIGDRVEPGHVYEDGTIPAPFDAVWRGGEADPWHVPIRVRSTYAAMDDIKAFAILRDSSLDGQDWSMRRTPDGGVLLRWGNGKMTLSRQEVESLARPHVSDGYFVVDVARRWDFSCDRDEWPDGFKHGPVRLDGRTVVAIRGKMADQFAAMSKEDLGAGMDNVEYHGLPSGRLLVMSMAALAMARKTRTAAFLYSV